jgi:hypothetical protein
MSTSPSLYDATVHEDQKETDMALGMGRQQYGLLSIWWD